MFAKGSLGDKKDINFFVDTGLVSFHNDGRQASVFTSTQTLLDLGYDKKDLEKNQSIELSGVVGLGPLLQSDQIAIHQEQIPFRNFGGVKISGLIAHAFLNKYRWTIDFENMKYTFEE